MSDTIGLYDESYPPSIYAPPAVPATGATAGIPGAWTPSGSAPPASVAALQGGVPNAVTASPATAWTAGQFVQTATSGAAGRATWTGTGWVGGVAPAVGADPNVSTVAQVQAYIEALGDISDADVQAETQRVLDVERAGQNRSTLVSWLDQRLGVEVAPQ